MMAYRQLVEKYAKQLNDANGRIIELETAIADRDAELERTKLAETQPKCEALNTNQEGQRQLQQASQRIRDLETSLAEVQEQLKTAKEAESHSSSSAREAKATSATLSARLQRTEIDLSNVLAGREVKETALNDQILELSDKIKSLNADKTALTRTIADLGKPVEEQQAKVDELERTVELEKKRRLEAEALLDPSRKRCQTCNPIVIDLEAEEGDGAQEPAQPVQMPKKPKLSLKIVDRHRTGHRRRRITSI